MIAVVGLVPPFTNFPNDMQRHQTLILASLVLIALLALSGAHPYDRATWGLEVFPVIIALPILWATYREFPLTTLVYNA